MVINLNFIATFTAFLDCYVKFDIKPLCLNVYISKF